MTPFEKLQQLKATTHTQLIRVESVKDGCVVVSKIYDQSKWTFFSIEKDILRRTLAQVSIPFRIRILDIEPEGSDRSPPIRTLGGYVSK